MSRLAMLVAVLAAGCSDNRPAAQRRERMVTDCMGYGHNPVDCANAAEVAIPRGQAKDIK